jgi:hypothetical protein
MKSTFFVGMFAVLVSGVATADINANAGAVSGSQSNSASRSSSNLSNAGNSSASSYGQGGNSQQQQGQGVYFQTNTAPNTGNTTSYVEAPDLGDSVPAFVTPGLTAGSNPCALSVSAGGAGAGFGFGLGWVYQDHECTVRENLRIVGGMLRKDGNQDAQLVLKNYICQSPTGWDAMEMAASEGSNPQLRCVNQRPGFGSYVKMRNSGEATSAGAAPRATSVSTTSAPSGLYSSCNFAPGSAAQNYCLSRQR